MKSDNMLAIENEKQTPSLLMYFIGRYLLITVIFAINILLFLPCQEFWHFFMLDLKIDFAIFSMVFVFYSLQSDEESKDICQCQNDIEKS